MEVTRWWRKGKWGGSGSRRGAEVVTDVVAMAFADDV